MATEFEEMPVDGQEENVDMPEDTAQAEGQEMDTAIDEAPANKEDGEPVEEAEDAAVEPKLNSGATAGELLKTFLGVFSSFGCSS